MERKQSRLLLNFIETTAASALIERLAMHSDISPDAARGKLKGSLAGIPVGLPGKPGRPKEVAAVMAFLLSASAAFIQGAEYVFDGDTLPTV